MNEQTKGLLQSKTTWGVLIALLGGVAGWGAETQGVMTEEVTRLVTSAFEVVGLLLALYGRFTATTRVSGLWKPKE